MPKPVRDNGLIPGFGKLFLEEFFMAWEIAEFSGARRRLLYCPRRQCAGRSFIWHETLNT